MQIAVMRVIKEVTCFFSLLILLVSCKKEAEVKKSIKSSSTSLSQYQKGDDLYTIDNYKDQQKTFSFLDQEFTSFKKTVLLNDLFFTAAVMPKEYFIKREMKKKDSLGYYLSELQTQEVVQFDIQSIDQSDVFKKVRKRLTYKQWVEYMSFHLKEDVFAITRKGDTIPSSGVFFERTYKVAPYKRVLIYFDFPEEQQDFKLVYYDRIYGNGFIKYTMN